MVKFFTSDLHLGCSNLVATTRPMYSSIEEHDEAVIGNINRTVGRPDSLYLLGDFCFHRDLVAAYKRRIRPKHIFFILGNHDHKVATCQNFGQVYQQKMVRLESGIFVFCCHYPVSYWDCSHNGSYHAYGHIHNSAEREAAMDSAFPGRRSMDVGIDSAYRILGEHRPFSQYEFLDILSGNPGHDIITNRR